MSVAWIAQFLETFSELGLDSDDLCRSAGIDPGSLTDPQVRLPRDSSGLLWRLALHRTQDQLLGLHAGERVQWKLNHVFPLLICTAPTLGAGIESIVRFQETLAHGRVLSLHGTAGNRRIRFSQAEEKLPVLAQEIEFVTVAALRLFQAASTRAFRFRKVTFPHEPLGLVSEYDRVLECPVEFGAAHPEWFLSEDSWQLTTAHRNPGLQAEIAGLAADALKTASRSSFVQEVSPHVRAGLIAGECSIEAVAAAMHTTARTLQRRLQAEGSSFREVLDDVRRSVVLLGLERGHSLSDTLHLAGFKDRRALRRALARWRIPVDGGDASG